jgi:hypothetical protein
MMHVQKNNKLYNYMYAYSLFTMSIDFHVARLQNKFGRICPQIEQA